MGKAKSQHKSGKGTAPKSDSETALCNISKNLEVVATHVTNPAQQQSAFQAQDDLDIWAKLVANKLRGLDPMKVERFQLKVMTMIYEMKEEHEREKSSK